MEKGTNGDKRGQRGQILSPFLSPLKRRCIGTNRIFSNLGSMEGDKQGTNKGQTGDKNPKVGDFDSPDVTEETAEQQKFCPLLNYLTIRFRPMYRKERFCPRFHLFYIYYFFFLLISLYINIQNGDKICPLFLFLPMYRLNQFVPFVPLTC